MLKTILKISAAAAVVFIGAAILKKNDVFPKLKKKLKEFDMNFAKNNSIKRRLKIVAKIMQNKIKETECRTSDENHKKRQEEYDKMNWDENQTQRCDLSL